MQLFSAVKKIFFFKLSFFFCPQKVEKTTLKSCSEKLKSTFFSLMPAAGLTAQTAQTEKFMFQNLATVYRTGALDNSFRNNFSLFQLKSVKEVTIKIAHGEQNHKNPIRSR